MDAQLRKLMMAIQRAILATFDQGDWLALGMQTDTLQWVQQRGRLLRGASWKSNEDYPGEILAALTHMLDKNLENFNAMLEMPKLVNWLRDNEPAVYSEFVGTPPSPAFDDHANAIRTFFWRNPASDSATAGFKEQRHDPMLTILQTKADAELAGSPRVRIFQCLDDAGCDLLIEWGNPVKYGVQLKSHNDISKKDFQTKTLAQIQTSKQHGLKRLYVLLAGDMTDKSHIQKARGFEADVSKMNDDYIVIVPPGRLWTLLFG